MKSIELKKGKAIMPNGDEIELTTYHCLKAAINFAPENGFTISDMMERLRVLGFVEEAKDKEILELEDADFDKLGKWVKAARWSVVSGFITDLAKIFV